MLTDTANFYIFKYLHSSRDKALLVIYKPNLYFDTASPRTLWFLFSIRFSSH